MTDYTSAYPYVDFFYMKEDRPTKWRRILHTDLPAAVNDAAGFNCYCSVQNFSSAVPAETDTAEMHYAPPYLDFDAEGDVGAAQADVLKVIDFFKTDFDLDDEAIRIWFSGSKGFHVTLSPSAFGVVPMLDLTYVYKRMFSHVAELLTLPTLDLTVYSKRRMWRVPNTIHAKTNLYKRELDHDEITDTVEAIKQLARSPRRAPLYPHDDDLEMPVAIACQEFFGRFKDEYLAEREATASTMGQVTLHPEAAEGDPVCVQDIMGNGLKKPGDRNKATMALGGYFKEIGTDPKTTIDTMTSWALALPPEHRQVDDNYIKANTASVLKTVFTNDNYHFSCKFIRSLHGPKTSADYDRVACAGDACPFIKGTLAPDPLLDVHLSRIGDPALLGKRIRTRLRVAGRQESAYLVPSRVVFKAVGDEECNRPHCALHAAGGRLERDFSTEAETRTLLTLCGVNDALMHTAIRKVVERTSCKNFTYFVEDHVRVIEMTCVPKAESFVFNPSTEKTVDETGGDFVYQRVYAVALDFKVNAYYEVEGRVFPHPRHQEATVVITDASPTQDAIEDFDLDAAKPLFKAYEGSPDAVLGHLVADIGVNVCKVAGRQPALLSLLMTMHAPLELRFGGDSYGGWMQTLMIGDTGEAKSQLVERLVRHVGLGELLSAQSSGRTGLLYTIITKDTAHNFIQWGSFVLNDRRLLVIDEASGIEKSGYAELRNARRDGIFKVTRSVSGEAQTRTRLVVLSNPRYGKNLSAFRNGIEAVEPLFENADIRRFDLVVGFRNGTVTRDTIETQLAEPVEHIFDAETLRANMLWAWSRKAEDIYWAPGAVEKVKAEAKRLNAKYEGSDIHLLSQDANEKIARMSQALAATLHSTDELHTMVHVLPEHVELVAELIDSVYASTDLDFEMYVKQNHEGTRGEVDYDDLMNEIHRKITLPHGVHADEIIENFSVNRVMNSFAMEAMAGDSKDAKMVARNLFRLGLIQTTLRGGFEPSAKFKELMRQHSRRRAGISMVRAG